MGPGRCLAALVLLLALLAGAAAEARREQPSIGGLHLYADGAGLRLDFVVERVLGDWVVETLDSGLPVRFTYWVRALRPRDYRGDDELYAAELTRVLEKDNLGNRYRVVFEDSGETRYLPDLAAAVAAMSRVEGLRLPVAPGPPPGDPLRVAVKARLQEFRLPFRLHYVFAFVSYWDVETDWFTVEWPGLAEATR